ncbi:MAG: hypothetical protein JO038_00780 [Alphaproteobacteria bacterium]|nr:hypothetical protein [Alphaproteobacteria bacterium]
MQSAQMKNASAAADAEEKVAKRALSNIEFPYADLDTAIEIANAVASIGGDGCELEQLAGLWRVSPTGGGFRAKYAPARIFALISIERGRVMLTPLGRRIIDRTQEAAARLDAFLAVPLYRSIYEKYRGFQLPGKDALENDIVNLGVAGTQKSKARQTFMRSARQGGLFWAGEDRLIRPNVNAAPPPTAPETLEQRAADVPPPAPEPRRGGGSGNGGSYDPLIQGLLNRLPEPGTVWAVEGRAAWLRAAATNFTLMYQGEGEIAVISKAPPPDAVAA